ncbi:hypothetical protein [Bordetella hinzii]|uniref:hypothetical protein n=1 Tax=Bordetella hinzii TaxID=103855 RepID=UPI00045B6D85|nr:hypothetical protein [Bordetella hinzii]KCB47102.1 hypothetical protein L537_0192 [Bordetella hinzii 1277]QWF40787.1 hypothetical protein HHA25_22225 [Bordetella hinzii]QWF45335.1 hypothetical protein HHA24_22210 [Bordetella hinzii]QWF49871.1 hypothetical protein HHA23_22215 [Bordetella hinzii]QWF54406.1 hypothetical protein HHA22_22220 [Bordetella hinzii]
MHHSTFISLKAAAALAATLLASAATAGQDADQACGAGTCGKKETSQPQGDAGDVNKKDKKKPGETAPSTSDVPEAGCGKKDAACAKR